MKKILPIIAVLGTTAIIGSFAINTNTEKKEPIAININSFQKDLDKYSSLNTENTIKTSFNKYKLSLETPKDVTLLNEENNTESDILNSNQNISTLEELESENPIETYENSNENVNNNDLLDNNNTEKIENSTENTDENEQQISTLYSLSSDIEDSCDDFCELKEEITNAIIETQNLITKLQQKEIELTPEQRIFITEQSMQLKNLGRQLANITTELSFNLSDLSQLMTSNNENIDNISLKYLVVLDNLINGNEMLHSGIQSLNLINQMFNMNSENIPSNNQGRILYGFKQNNNPAVIKDYYIDENGKIIENKNSDQTTENQNTDQTTNNEQTPNEQAINTNDNKNNIDTYKNSILTSNIDTYQTQNPPKNIDSFFNTALLDNEFMYGNGGYGYGMNNGLYGANPYMNSYYQYQQNNSINGVENKDNTQPIENTPIQPRDNNKKAKKNKKFKITKNIDTYQDKNEPHIKVKIAKIKDGITNFFTGFKNADLSEKTDNPIYKLDK